MVEHEGVRVRVGVRGACLETDSLERIELISIVFHEFVPAYDQVIMQPCWVDYQALRSPAGLY